MNKHVFVVALFVLGVGLAYGDDHRKCDVTKESIVPISGEQSAVHHSKTISESPCYQWSPVITISSIDDEIEQYTTSDHGQGSVGISGDLVIAALALVVAGLVAYYGREHNLKSVKPLLEFMIKGGEKVPFTVHLVNKGTGPAIVDNFILGIRGDYHGPIETADHWGAVLHGTLGSLGKTRGSKMPRGYAVAVGEEVHILTTEPFDPNNLPPPTDRANPGHAAHGQYLQEYKASYARAWQHLELQVHYRSIYDEKVVLSSIRRHIRYRDSLLFQHRS